MDPKKAKLIILVLIGVCILSLVLAINAGSKRKVAVNRTQNMQEAMANLESKLSKETEAKTDLAKDLDFTKTKLEVVLKAKVELEEALEKEKETSASLKAEMEKIKSILEQHTKPRRKR